MENHLERYNYNPSLKWNDKVEEYFIKAYGADHFSRISKALTRPSCYSCVRVNTLKSTTNTVIEKLSAILQGKWVTSEIDSNNIQTNDVISEVDMRRKQETISEECHKNQDSDHNVMIRSLLYGDAPEASLHGVPISTCQLPGLDYVLFVKGSGPHEIQYDSSQPIKEVIVSRKCAEAVLRGAQVFVPGVLACSAHVEIGDIVAVSVALEQPLDGGWGVGITRGTILEGSHKDPHYLERRGLYIGQGTTMLSRAGMFRASSGVAVEMTDRVYNLHSFHGVLEGEIFLQNLPSIITAHALDPQPGDRLLDMCAAPGGKTTALAILMKDNGTIIAADRSHNKVLDIKRLATEMGLNCIIAHRLDALKSVCQRSDQNHFDIEDCNKEGAPFESKSSSEFCIEDKEAAVTKAINPHISCNEEVRNGENSTNYQSKAELRKNTRRMRNGVGRNQTVGGKVQNSKGFSPNSFDRVLLDGPCSALGLRPRLFTGEETIESLKKHGKYQKKMFDQAVQLVRPGGILVYSTCTINPGENEALVRYALDTYKFLSLAPQQPRIGGPGLVGRYESTDGCHVEEWLTPEEAELVQRFDPSSSLDTIGFFIAKFRVGEKEN